jgi:hypothetical protein
MTTLPGNEQPWRNPRRHRGDPPPKIRFAPDSPLEGDGFELSVPRERGHRFELSLLFMSLKPSAF